MPTPPEGTPPVFPTLLAVSTRPTELTPGKGLGVREKVEVTVTDHPYTDVGIDPYLANRPTDSNELDGSLWTRSMTSKERRSWPMLLSHRFNSRR